MRIRTLTATLISAGALLVAGVSAAPALASSQPGTARVAPAIPAYPHMQHVRWKGHKTVILKNGKRLSNCGSYFGLFTANGRGEQVWWNAPISQYDPAVQSTTQDRTMRFCQDAGSFNGHAAGELQLNINGDFVAADTSCDDIVDKSTQNQLGTVWGQENVGNGDILWHSRECDSPDFVMSADNVTGDHWKVKANGANGWYQKVDKI